MLNIIKMFLGFLGFNYCPKCGDKMEVLYTHGYDDVDIMVCKKHDYKKILKYKKFKESSRSANK